MILAGIMVEVTQNCMNRLGWVYAIQNPLKFNFPCPLLVCPKYLSVCFYHRRSGDCVRGIDGLHRFFIRH